MNNIVILHGRVGRDPEVRHNDKVTVAKFTMAVDDGFGDKKHTEWVSCVCFNKTAEIAEKYVHKGDPLNVTGRLHTNKWQDKEGNDKYRTEVIINSLTLLGKKSDGLDKPAEVNQEESFNESDSIPF